MKLTCLLFGVVLGATLLGCGGADLGCSNDSYVPECVNSYQRYICTHGEKAIEECITGYSCVDKGDKGARCVADSLRFDVLRCCRWHGVACGRWVHLCFAE